jgi:hypothetical protein
VGRVVPKTWRQVRRLLFDRVKQAANAVAGWSAALLLAGIHHCDRVAVSNIAGAFMRTIGPWLPEHRVGRDNLRAAFPDKSYTEIASPPRSLISIISAPATPTNARSSTTRRKPLRASCT